MGGCPCPERPPNPSAMTHPARRSILATHSWPRRRWPSFLVSSATSHRRCRGPKASDMIIDGWAQIALVLGVAVLLAHPTGNASAAIAQGRLGPPRAARRHRRCGAARLRHRCPERPKLGVAIRWPPAPPRSMPSRVCGVTRRATHRASTSAATADRSRAERWQVIVQAIGFTAERRSAQPPPRRARRPCRTIAPWSWPT